MEKRTIRTYEHEGTVLGSLVEYPSGRYDPKTGRYVTVRKFETDLGVFEVIDLVRKLEPEDRVHMRTSAYGLYRTLQHFEINPDDYIDDEDIAIHVMNRGYRNLTDLCRGDHRAWELIKQRGLVEKVFPTLQPAVSLTKK